MAITIAARPIRLRWSGEGKKKIATDVTLDNSYPTGGWAISNVQLGFGANDSIDFVICPVASTGHSLRWDYANKKLQAFSAMGTELVNASAALNGVVVRLLVFGN